MLVSTTCRLLGFFLLLFSLSACTKKDSEPERDLTATLVGTYDVSQWVQRDGAALPTILVPSGTSSVVVKRVDNNTVEMSVNTDMKVTFTINGATTTTTGKESGTTQVGVRTDTSGDLVLSGTKYAFRPGELYYLVCTVPLNANGTNTVDVYARSQKR